MKTQDQIDREHEQRERMGAIHDAAEALLNRELTRNHFGDYNAVDRWEVARFGEKEDIVLVVIDCENWVNDGPLYELALQSLGFLEGAEGCDEERATFMSGSAQAVLDEMGPEGLEVAGWSMGGTRVLQDFQKALYAARLSSEFSRLVRRDAGTGAVLAAIIEKNKNISPTCCATHDYWDSNMTMLEAWDNIIKREMDCASEADACLWGAAWDSSKAVGFSN